MACFRRNPSQLAVFGVVLTAFLFAWMQAAMLIFTLFFDQKPPPLGHLLEILRLSPDAPVFLMVGTAVGAVFAAIMFTITAVSVPFLQHRKVDIMTAIAVSVSAVRINWLPMIIWGGLIVFFVGLGVASMFLGLVVVLPVLAYGTWHSYEDMVQPAKAGTPAHSVGIT